MKAMILAAGKGTRLQPLTLNTPKALIPIANHPALEWGIRRLDKIGVQSIIINTHHHSEQLEAYVRQHQGHSPELTLSNEDQILGTGGGLLKTKDFWDPDPFILHNADIFSTADLLSAYRYHKKQQNLATLLTQDRVTQTKLLIDEQQFICGIHYYKTENYQMLRAPQGAITEQGFCGIHVISPQIFSLIQEVPPFSIIDCYLRLIQENHPLRAFDIKNAYWKDMGTPRCLEELEADWYRYPAIQECYSL
ncbi:nucleotidyltransferase family protein [Deltaproteobacteria bacterium TL4]